MSLNLIRENIVCPDGFEFTFKAVLFDEDVIYSEGLGIKEKNKNLSFISCLNQEADMFRSVFTSKHPNMELFDKISLGNGHVLLLFYKSTT